jgi:putative glutamine amidotransferase|tara:strand:+ start:7082 stop:7792 length:711 start_codon:yes stop_codon:yes gene_type:complete
MKQSIIGITVDSESPGGYSKQPWYALRKNYCQMVSDSGGAPILLPHETKLSDLYIKKIDGLLITGGNFDIDPRLYGEKKRFSQVTPKEGRTNFEIEITRKAIRKNIPILGICGGQQLLNVAFGGSLIQHIPKEIKSPLKHEQTNPRTEAGHRIKVFKDTLLYKIVKKPSMNVNSAHHQAVKNPGRNLSINAIAEDGLIEGIENNNKKFCLGIQWHPEYSIDSGDKKIFQAFVRACK